MSTAVGLILAFAIIGVGGAALAGCLIWLYRKDLKERRGGHSHDA